MIAASAMIQRLLLSTALQQLAFLWNGRLPSLATFRCCMYCCPSAPLVVPPVALVRWKDRWESTQIIQTAASRKPGPCGPLKQPEERHDVHAQHCEGHLLVLLLLVRSGWENMFLKPSALHSTAFQDNTNQIGRHPDGRKVVKRGQNQHVLGQRAVSTVRTTDCTAQVFYSRKSACHFYILKVLASRSSYYFGILQRVSVLVGLLELFKDCLEEFVQVGRVRNVHLA